MKDQIKRSSLWIVGIGLMIASSGIDGAYLARIMPPVLGYTLNTVSDIGSEVLMYWFARIRQTSRKGSKAWALSLVLLAAEALLIAYAWFFGWRQLRLVLPEIEGGASEWVAVVSAGFVPVSLAAVGLAQALIDGKLDADGQATETRAAPVEKPKTATISHWRTIYPSLDGKRATLDANGVQAVLKAQGFAPVATTTARRWAEEARK